MKKKEPASTGHAKSSQSELLVEVDKIKALMRSLNVSFSEKPRQKTIEKLHALPEEEAVKLIEQMKQLGLIYSSAHNIQVSAENHFEFQMFCKAADFLGFEDVQYLKKYIAPQDCIEIYSDEAVQLYRSLSFFRTSSYALEDLLVNPWFELWLRPSFVNTDLMERMHRILSGRGDRVQTDVPTYLLREIYFDKDSNQRERDMVVKNKAVGPLKTKGNSKAIKGFFVITECSVVSDNIAGR